MELLSLNLLFVLMFQDKNGKQLSVEVAVMLKLGMTGSAVSLLDWYDLDKELILVLERPVPSVDLFEYNEANGGGLKEEEAKVSNWRILVNMCLCAS